MAGFNPEEMQELCDSHKKNVPLPDWERYKIDWDDADWPTRCRQVLEWLGKNKPFVASLLIQVEEMPRRYPTRRQAEILSAIYREQWFKHNTSKETK